MKKMQITACALAVLTITSLPSQAKDIEVKVAGTISPSGCTPTLSGDGAIDYGVIKSDSLALDAYTTLEQKFLELTITCDAPVKLALEAKNGRPNTLAGVATEDAISGAALSPTGSALEVLSTATAVVGLGVSGSARIGGYALMAAAVTFKTDGTDAQLITREGNSGEWEEYYGIAESNNFYSIGVKRQLSWKNGSIKEPAAFQKLTGKVKVQAYINKASELDLTKPVILDGLTTLELVYL
ncbi:DUF1120 domain-containing protein [Serratia liquefaciens]|uniref:DUF1120 domain-containing protein n=1 Tax=Serratia TaxID=613 RepID=UPI00065FA349|nr:DUF1120 domain-containing protein [Serratia liquefaciens]AMH00714.1 DUF1120 domain-containing protein [Serratia liquefaciens]HCT7986545.1 DUF1120 domain-containing protein [Serratia liquefaciens]HEI8956031.1 DUF1120 domain-containing protein [Serratia liquefaciens]